MADVNNANAQSAAARATQTDGFRQAMLKTALETIPQLTEENYPIWKDKMEALLELRGLLGTLNSPARALFPDDNAELKLLLISKMDSVTHNNVVTSDNRDSAKALWQSIKEQFASSQSSNRARVFNNFLYLVFREDNIEQFVTETKVAIKKLVDVGIDLPQDVLAYLILFKFPTTLHSLKRQVMHSDKELNVQFVCNHLTQYNNEAKAETKEDPGTTDAALFSSKDKRKNNPQSGKSKSSNRCTPNHHNPKQDENHAADSCWHLHPDKAPDWWKEGQAKWKASKSETNYFMSLLTLWVEKGDNKSRIILDSGASAHIFNDKRFFSQLTLGMFEEIKTGKEDATLPIKGKGSVRMKWGDRAIELKNCLYVPDIVINLVSAGMLDQNGCKIHSESGKFTVKKNGILALKGKVEGNLYTIENPISIGSLDKEAHYSLNEDQIKEIHESYGHASIQRLGQMIPSQITNRERQEFQCKSCVVSKITKKPFKLTSKTVKRPWERIHLDLIGPIKPQSLGQHKYILSVTDNATGYLAGLPLVHKSDTVDTLISLLENEKRRLGYFPNQICSDGGGEFLGTRLVQFLAHHHIKQLISEPYHPEHNGRAERANRTIVESMRATFKASNLKKNMWHYVVKSCCLALNQIPKKGEELSPWEAMQGYRLPDDYLKPLGNPVIYLNNRRKKGEKFTEKGAEGRLIGYNAAFRSYKILTPDAKISHPGLRFGIKGRMTTRVIPNQTPKQIKPAHQMKEKGKYLKIRRQLQNLRNCQTLEPSETDQRSDLPCDMGSTTTMSRKHLKPQ
ncbi:hypothetical protein VP01_1406g1 [Puccinia sorghi]|uniref:Integrase catalytic domain-containing protein n=1 Tax=Puccinia sorghi TaxID=27349 RepID=A0A0L6VLG2_9BASI|nr:hypothetical protein VP01_1406g1 [Puccinia sorghi]